MKKKTFLVASFKGHHKRRAEKDGITAKEPALNKLQI
jgi:hypothetical protein